jgi:hypothetical protein
MQMQSEAAELRSECRTECRACGLAFHTQALEIGAVPILNRFSHHYTEAQAFQLAVAACSYCGLVQLSRFAPLEAIVPRITGISYRERSDHLNDVAMQFRLLVPDTHCSIRALSPFDGPLLELLKPEYADIAYIDLLHRSNGQVQDLAYIESIENRLLNVSSSDPCDILTYRYLLEHCRDPLAVLHKMRQMLRPGGMLVIEIPDSAKFIERCDYSFIWEEHQCYFTEKSVRAIFAYAGLDIIALHRYAGAFEDALVVMARPGTRQSPSSGPSEEHHFRRFRDRFTFTKTAYGQVLLRQSGESALIGIGHQALMFAHMFGIAQRARYFIDDAPLKRGMYSEGIDHAIVSFAELADDARIATAYLAVGPQNELQVRERLQPYLLPNANVYSIFEASTFDTAIDRGI